MTTPRGAGRGWLAAAGALALYAAASALLLGRAVLAHPGSSYVGFGNDAEIFIWMLGWWPHALGQGHDPFAAQAVWAPGGVNLAWVTSVPAAALLLWPVTAAFGPVASYNLAILAAPALSAWTAFLLCRHLTRRDLASLAGGYAYGFSAYELGQTLGHLHAAFCALVPLVALVLVRSVQGELDGRGTVLRLVPLLVLQFGFSTEVFLSLALVSGAALALAWRVLPERRDALSGTLRRGLVAGGICAVLVSPYLVEAAAHLQTGAINSPFTFSADLLSTIVPPRLVLLGGDLFGPLSDRFRGNLAENGAYLGLPLLGAIGLVARERWGRRELRFLVIGLACLLVAELGPLLAVAGVRVLPLPWLPLAVLPVLDNVLPVRLAAYAALAAAVLLALFLADEHRPGRRWALGLLALAVLVPDVGAPFWHEPGAVPALFRSEAYRRVIPRDANVLVLPFANQGDGMLWQAEARYWFREADGYLTPDPPSEVADDPFVRVSQRAAPGAPGPEWAPALRRFIDRRRVDLVLLDEQREAAFGPLLAALRAPVQRVGGVLVYRVGR